VRPERPSVCHTARIARLVAEHLTGTQVPLTETTLLTGMVPALSLFNCISVASAFGDQATVTRLDTEIDGWIARLPQYYQHLINVSNDAAAA
jgi:hypothetical protein